MQTIGERLEEARKRKGVSIREAAEATKIRGDYLHKFENNQFDIKLPEIYVRGFLRTYALFLKLPGDKIVNDYRGLGLGEAKSTRGLSRESYGRMDISVSTAKAGAAREPSPAPAPAATAQPPADVPPSAGPADNNPATFRPRAGAGPQIDRGLLIKAGLALGGLIILVILSVVLVRVMGSSSTSTRPTATANNQVLIDPLAGEPTLTIVASGSVAVTLRVLDTDTVLFKGNLTTGETRVVPRRGKIRVEADPGRNLEFIIGDKRYSMPAGANQADVPAPVR